MTSMKIGNLRVNTAIGKWERIQVGTCSECHRPIYEDEKKVMMFHERCLQIVKETKRHLTYRIPSTGGTIRIGK